MMANKEWHLDKSVSLGHILTTAVLFASAVSAFYSLSTRLSVVEDKIITVLESQVRIDERQDRDLIQFRGDMRAIVVDMNAKLDILVEHQLQ